MKVLDSDHWIALLPGHLDLRGPAAPDEELAMTAISVGELVHGASKSARVTENLARLDVLLAAATILPYDDTTVRTISENNRTLKCEHYGFEEG